MSLITASSAPPDWRIMSRYWRWRGVGSRSESRSAMPITQFMGVRISWLMLARNSLLARLLAWAWTMASFRERSVSSLSHTVMNRSPTLRSMVISSRRQARGRGVSTATNPKGRPRWAMGTASRAPSLPRPQAARNASASAGRSASFSATTGAFMANQREVQTSSAPSRAVGGWLTGAMAGSSQENRRWAGCPSLPKRTMVQRAASAKAPRSASTRAMLSSRSSGVHWTKVLRMAAAVRSSCRRWARARSAIRRSVTSMDTPSTCCPPVRSGSRGSLMDCRQMVRPVEPRVISSGKVHSQPRRRDSRSSASQASTCSGLSLSSASRRPSTWSTRRS